MDKRRIRYHLLALAVVAVWGVTFVSTKVLIGAGMHPVAIFLVRFVLAYAGIWLYIGLAKEKTQLWYGWKDELVFLILGVTGGSFYFLAENTALAHTQACNVAFLVCSAPLFTAIFTLIFKRLWRGRFADGLENIRLGWPLIGGTLLALGGMALVVFDGTRLQLSASGDLLAIGAALCWAAYSLFMAQMTKDYGTITATRKVFFYGLLTILPFIGNYRESFTPAILSQTAVWANLLFLGLVASLVCFILWNLVMEKLGNVTSTNYVYLNPVFTLLTATALLDERMTLLAGIGCAAILAGVVWAGGAHAPAGKGKYTALCVLFLILMQGCSTRNDKEALREEIESITAMKQLGTVECRVRKIIKADDQGEWYKIGERKILFSCTAYLKAGIDLSSFSADDIVTDRKARKISVKLPHATLLSLDIPPSEIREEYDQVTLLRSSFSIQERNELLKQGERQIRSSVPSLGILQKAEENARKFFESAFGAMGFTTVEVVFK